MDNKPGRVYVLDTTVLIYDPDILSKTAEVDWVIPLVVIKELDGLKNSEK
jgi:predicted ribonuclease YlaK